MRYNKKILLTLFFITFSMSTLLSVSGLSNEIAAFYAVDIEASSLYVGAFLFIVGITAIFLPAYLSKYERKRFFIIALVVTVISTLVQSFVNDFMVSFILRIIPAFFYSTAISFALTYIGDVDPDNVNKVVLGITSGCVFGASFSIYITTAYGYNYKESKYYVLLIAGIMGVLVTFLAEAPSYSFMDCFNKSCKSGSYCTVLA